MRTIDFIVSYLRTEASFEEKQAARKALTCVGHPPVNSEYVVMNLMKKGRAMYNGQNRLDIVKFVKDETAWGLKESKDFCEENIFQ